MYTEQSISLCKRKFQFNSITSENDDDLQLRAVLNNLYFLRVFFIAEHEQQHEEEKKWKRRREDEK